MNMELDHAGRLAGFRARFGRAYDSNKGPTATRVSEPSPSEKSSDAFSGKETRLDDNGFEEEEDANLLDLISSYGQVETGRGPKKGDGNEARKENK